MSNEAEKEGTRPELDEHGLVVHEYDKTILVVVPPEDFAEATMRYARAALLAVDVGTRSVSTQDKDLVHGTAGDQFQVDGLIKDARMDDYAGVLFCGGAGCLPLAEDAHVVRLAREATAQNKPIGAWGQAPTILARAGVLAKRKVTGDSSIRELLEKAGAKYTGAQVQVDGLLVTGLDDTAGLRFSRALAEVSRAPG